MERQRATFTERNGDYPWDGTGQAILDLLQRRDMRPGDSINIILAQFEIERKGIGNAEFSAGVMQLLDNGLLNMQGNVFYLTYAGFEALRRTRNVTYV